MPASTFTFSSPDTSKLPGRALGFMMWSGILTILAVPLILLGVILPGDGSETWRAFLVFPGLLFLVMTWVLVPLASRRDKRYLSQFADAVAKANDFDVEHNIKPKYDRLFYPAVADVGLRARDIAVAHGVIDGRQVAIYAHTYLTGFLQFKRRYAFYVKVDFNVQLPHIMLQSRKEQGKRFITAVGRTFDDNQRVSLQGDLDKYFLFYTHRRTVTDALTVLSPQLLEQLQKLDCTLSMETVGKSAYFYMDLPDTDEIDMPHNARFINKTVSSIIRTTRTDFMKLPNDKKYPFLRSRPTGGVVEWAGKYFNYAVVVLVGQFIWNMSRLFLDTASEMYPYRWWIAAGSALITSGMIAYLLTARSKYTRTILKRGY